ncbi:hypothetical protein VIN01S_04560 [Vibrio inusitatus NBRC 102082]|uniref:Uncharacterized protein n=1 Tax=Vibrio inusitatus NBRC 102082 TaxID=1219070 RepID=A0A4Y3HSA5_9VIBR|nr:hypothetical protein [Vibrio inusitatus]GEA49652.1 hypothetical protein VIN01S_04560 [Vibrio inusitatus NBRC 102082]
MSAAYSSFLNSLTALQTSLEKHSNESDKILVSALVAWDCYVKVLAQEVLVEKYGEVLSTDLGSVMQTRLNNDLADYDFFDSQTAQVLFNNYFSVDITQHWSIVGVKDVEEACQKLDRYQFERYQVEHCSECTITSLHGFTDNPLCVLLLIKNLGKATQEFVEHCR